MHFIYGIESVMEYIDYLPHYELPDAEPITRSEGDEQTNINKLRDFSVEELAKWFLDRGLSPESVGHRYVWDPDRNVKEEWVEWLQSSEPGPVPARYDV